jgi:hypothetical protein
LNRKLQDYALPSTTPFLEKTRKDCFKKDLKVEPQGHMFKVVKVEPHFDGIGSSSLPLICAQPSGRDVWS